MVQEAASSGVQSTCDEIQRAIDAWRALLSRQHADATAPAEPERLATGIALLANALWDALETEAVHVLVRSDALCRPAQVAPTDLPAALDALEQAVRQLRGARCVRRRPDRAA